MSCLRSSNGSEYQFALGVAPLRHRVEADRALQRQLRVEALLPVVRDALAPRREPRLERRRRRGPPRTRAAPARRPRCDVYSDSSVSDTYESTSASGVAAQLVLERLEPGEIGAERHHPEVGLVAEHREQQRLVAVGLERRAPRRATRLPACGSASARAVDPVEEVEHAPPDRRLDRGSIRCGGPRGVADHRGGRPAGARRTGRRCRRRRPPAARPRRPGTPNSVISIVSSTCP